MKKHLFNHKFDLGILVIRIGIGIMFIIHGYPKVFGGAQKWEKLGGAAAKVGLDFLPHFWGFMAAFSEFFGGVLLMIGFFFNTMFNVVDTLCAGWLGTEALAALSLSFPAFFVVLAIGSGLSQGSVIPARDQPC